jgi:tetratricopeptide (TPR) repeat protein
MAAGSAGAPPVEVFYSYSHKDEWLRDELETHLSLLKRTGVIADWHDRRITAGTEWAGQIDEHLESAGVILLLISADFLASDYCYDIEMKRALERHESREARVIPIIIRPVDWRGAPFGKLQALPTDGKAVTSWPNRDEAWTNVAQGIRTAVEELTPQTTTRPARIWNVPFLRNPNFTGRDEELAALRRTLTSGQPAAVTQAITGLGGVGKTQLAVEYAYRHAADYDVIWWIRADNATTLESDFAALAAEVHLPEARLADQTQITAALKRWLRERGRWLLVFDNAHRREDIRPYLVQAGGHTIITSREASWGSTATTVPVKGLLPDNAVGFLLMRTDREEAGAAPNLAKELGYLPLALEQAAAYIAETGMSFQSYLRLFREKRSAVFERPEAKPDDYPLTVATTWTVAVEPLERESPAAVALLRLCAFLAPEKIPLDVIRHAPEYLPEPLASVAAEEFGLREAVARLHSYSLVEAADDLLTVHRLVQMVTFDGLDDSARRMWVKAAVTILNDAFPDGDAEPDTWAVSAPLLSHALYAAELGKSLPSVQEVTSELLEKAGAYLLARAQYQQAHQVLNDALDIAEHVYGPDHPRVASCLSNVGGVLQTLGEFDPARAAFERALRIDEQIYGPNAPTVAGDINNLGFVLQDLGDLPGARTAFERALRIDEQAESSDQAAIARHINNLGTVQRALGDLPAARVAFERALRINEQVYGPDSRSVATGINNLGSVQRALGDLPAARAAFERALRIDEQIYGPDHPEVATDVNNLGRVLQDLGDLPAARAAYERALRIFQVRLGDNHPNTLIVRKKLESLGGEAS